MFREDNTGFINFPASGNEIVIVDSGKTLVYIVCFDILKKYKHTKLENINLFSPGIFVSDDVVARPSENMDSVTFENLIENQKQQENYDAMYFPNNTGDEFWRKQMSIDFISAICVGWANMTYEYRNDIKFWNASFRDLTHEGKNLYYGMKKLHNSKEVRILTFNTN